MSDAATARFTCDSCGKSYAWKPELAGKRAKCKCGSVMTVPATQPSAEEPQDLYDLAPDNPPPQPKKSPKVPLAPLAPRNAEPVRQSAAIGFTTVAAAAPLAGGRGGAAPIGVGYQSAPVKKDRFSNDTLMDMKRDVHVPTGLLIAGFLIYILYYMFRYEVSGSGIGFVAVGVGMMIAFKAVLLIGFALVIAGPVGVSFGGLFTAILKLAAITVFCDGVTSWVDYGVDRMSGTSGFFGMMISFPVALAIYWLLLIYLFSMDSGDSWLVVMLLAVFDFVVRWALILLVLGLIMNWGGVSLPGSAAAGFGGGGGGGSSSAASAHAEMRRDVREMRESKQLEEARQFIAGGRQAAFTNSVNGWYDAGCANVWFQVDRDFDGRMTPVQIVVELPRDKSARAKCYEIWAKWEKEMGNELDPEDLEDDGAPYLFVEVP